MFLACKYPCGRFRVCLSLVLWATVFVFVCSLLRFAESPEAVGKAIGLLKTVYVV
jgi:hypothetical protein